MADVTFTKIEGNEPPTSASSASSAPAPVAAETPSIPAAVPAASPSSSISFTPIREPSFIDNVGTGLMDRLFGALQLGASAELPEQAIATGRPETATEPQEGIRRKLETREKQIQSEGGGGWGRTVGNVLADIGVTAPLSLIPGAAIPTVANRIAQAVKLGMAGGGITGALQPSTSDSPFTEKAEQIGGGLVGGGALGGVFGGLAGAISRNSPEAINDFIRRTYMKAVRPSVAAGRTTSQLNRYLDQAKSGIDTIVENKKNLQFVEPETGIRITGEAPETLEQFGDAIGQTKRQLFRQYDALAQASGSQGVAVGLEPVVGELQKVATNRPIALLHPNAQAYAQQLAERFRGQGFLTVTDAQEAIEHLNASLKAFYRNPSYDNATKAGIDAMVANNLRKGLDVAIEGTVAPGYQALKNQYGALKAIENHVLHRAVVDARKGSGILASIGDVVSAEELIRGALTLNPHAIATGAGVKGITMFLKRLREPNRAIKKLFEAAEREPSQGASAIADKVGRVAPVAGGLAGDAASSSLSTAP